MSNPILRLLSGAIFGLLLIFTGRRWLFTVAALWPKKPSHEPLPPATTPAPELLLLVPVRNEAQTLPELLTALERLTYPAKNLTVLFVDDGSTDASPALLQRHTANHPTWRLLSLPRNRGKAEALNAALAKFPNGEIIAIYDADERPAPDALAALVSYFVDGQVGGVSGRRAVQNSLASPAASYTTFEGLVHQLITLRAKDRLALAPPLLGSNCAYRRAALAQVGYFKPGALLEDTDLTVKLARAGWRLRFAPEAVSYHRAPETITGYWRQHTRWARGFNEVAKAQAKELAAEAGLSLRLRLELLLFALGYLDRLALLLGLPLALAKNRLAIWGVLLHLLTPLVQVGAALKLAQAPPALWRRVLWLPFFFGLDIAMALTGLWGTVQRRAQPWEERRQRP